MKIVIIGYGIAAANAAKRLKKEGHDITIISAEEHAPFYRARVLELLEGKSVQDISMPREDVNVIQGRAVKIDREDRAVVLESGERVSYDELILATGANANSLPVKSERIVTVRTIADTEDMMRKLDASERVAVLGGGLLGLEAAVKIHEYTKKRVSVIESAGWLLSRQFKEAEGRYLEKKLSAMGLDIITGAAGAETEDGVKVTLADGRVFEFDLLVCSIGVRPETSLAAACGLKVNRGIVVDEHLRTSDEHISAIGDVAEADGRTPCMISTALDMARVVLNPQKSYKAAAPSAVLKIAGLDAISMGSEDEGSLRTVREDEDKREVFVTKDGVLTGYYAIGTSANLVKAKLAMGKPFDVTAF